MSRETEPMERDLLLCDRISDSTVKNIITDIFKINRSDNEKQALYKDSTRPPIRLFLNTFGGNPYDALALVDVIKNSPTPVHTICVGSCMSAGLWVWLSGTQRFIGENSTLMFHDIYSRTSDKTVGVQQELNEMVRLQKLFVAEITKKSLISADALNGYIERKAEWYIPADEALTLRLADGYYTG